MCDGKYVWWIVSVSYVDFSRREIVTGSEIRIDKKTQLYGQLIEGCTVIPRLTKIIRSGITFVSPNVIYRRFL